MVTVSVTASVKVEGGPTLPVSATIDPLSYTFASTELEPSGGPGHEQSIDLLPEGGTVVLLAVNARTASGDAAEITITPSNDDNDGTALSLDGTFVIANPGVLAVLVDGGPRTLTLANEATEGVTVDVLAGLGSAVP